MIHQQPLHSGFGATTTAESVLAGVRLDGRKTVVTGGYSGLGLEVTRNLVAAGAHVFVPARSTAKARERLAGLPNVEVLPMNLMSPRSIKDAARTIASTTASIELLVNCAGVMAPPLQRDARGYESQFSVNHLGHFELTAELWPALCRSGNSRVISVASLEHQRGDIDFHDPNFEHRAYDKWSAYGQSKTANVLFAVNLDRRGYSSGVRAFSVHPGGILTDLSRYLSNEEVQAKRIADGSFATEQGMGKTVSQGAASILWCAVSQQLNGRGGLYCEDCDIAVLAPSAGPLVKRGVRPWAIDTRKAERLWALSERLTNVRWPA